MAIAVGVHASAVNASPVSTTGIVTQATGSSFLVFCYYNGSFTSLADNKGNTYGAGQIITSDVTPTYFGAAYKIRVYLVVNGAGGSGHTWTMTVGGTGGELFVVEIKGADTSSPLDANPGAVEDNASPFTTNSTGTLAKAAELIIAGFFGNASGGTETWTIGGGFTTLEQFTNSSTTLVAAIASLGVSATTAVQASTTTSLSTVVDGFIYSFKEASGSTVNTKNLSDAVDLSDQVGDKSLLRYRAASDTISLIDELVSQVLSDRIFTKQADDAIEISDFLSGTRMLSRELGDTLVVFDAEGIFKTFSITSEDAVATLSDDISHFSLRNRATSDQVDMSDALQRQIYLYRLAGDAIALADELIGDVTYSANINYQTLSDAIDITDAVDRQLKLYRLLSDAADLADDLVAQLSASQIYNMVLTDGLVTVDELSGSVLAVRSVSDSVAAIDEVLESIERIRGIIDAVDLSDDSVSIRLNERLLAEAIGISDELVASVTRYVLYTNEVNIVIGVAPDTIIFGGSI